MFNHTILGITSFEYPDADLVAAICRAGAFGVLDMGDDVAAARSALTAAAQLLPDTPFGVRVPRGVVFDPCDLPSGVEVVVLSSADGLARWRPRRVLVQVRSVEEGQRAVQAGADGLIAKGEESGGLVGDESSFILLQRLVGAFTVPIWVQGGVGLHTAAACLAGGAAGVVLDSQLALVQESKLPAASQPAWRVATAQRAAFSGPSDRR